MTLVSPTDANERGPLPLRKRQRRRFDIPRMVVHKPKLVVSIALVAVFVTMAIAPDLYARADPWACDLSSSLDPPTAAHWFGFDVQGCDYYAQTVHGARASMAVGGLVVVSSALIAVALGTVTGYFGGVVDAILGRITDVWFGIPIILAGIVILSFIESRGVFEVSLVLVTFGWPLMLRIMRSSVLTTKQAEYIEAARVLGASDWRIITRHLVPNAVAPVLIYATLYVGTIITAEAILSFMGVGLQLPAISWGIMLAEAQQYVRRAPHLLIPGVFLSAAVFGFVLLGDALRDALEPKRR